MPCWRIEMKRGKSTDEIGVIAAPTKTDAIRQAIKTLDISSRSPEPVGRQPVDQPRVNGNGSEIAYQALVRPPLLPVALRCIACWHRSRIFI